MQRTRLTIVRFVEFLNSAPSFAAILLRIRRNLSATCRPTYVLRHSKSNQSGACARKNERSHRYSAYIIAFSTHYVWIYIHLNTFNNCITINNCCSIFSPTFTPHRRREDRRGSKGRSFSRVESNAFTRAWWYTTKYNLHRNNYIDTVRRRSIRCFLFYSFLSYIHGRPVRTIARI